MAIDVFREADCSDVTWRHFNFSKNNEENIPFIILGKRSYVAHSVIQWDIGDSLIIGKYCSIATDINFYLGVSHDYFGITTYPFDSLGLHSVKRNKKNKLKNQLIIGNDVWIGANASIMGGISIGNGAVIGANAVVTKDVEPYSIVAGNPATIIKYRFDKETREKLNQIKWWNWSEEYIFKAFSDVEYNVEKFVEKNYQEDVVAEIIELNDLKNSGYKIYTFLPDFDNDFPVWKKVIEEYFEEFSSSDKVILVLLSVSNNEKHRKSMEDIIHLIRKKGITSPNIANFEWSEEMMQRLLKTSDFYITTREYITSYCVDYASTYGVKILFSTENSIFIDTH